MEVDKGRGSRNGEKGIDLSWELRASSGRGLLRNSENQGSTYSKNSSEFSI